MKRGFLNTPRSKRVIEDAYAPRSPPGPSPPHNKKPSPLPRPMQNSGKEAIAAVDAMAAVGHVSNANGRVVAMHTTRSTEGEAQQTPELLDHGLDSDIKAELSSKDRKGKGKEKVVDLDDDDMDVDTSPHDDPVEAELPSKDRKGKGKEKVVDFDVDDVDINTSLHDDPSSEFLGYIPPRPWPRNPPGWGRHPDEEFFHTVPQSHGGPYRKRAVFRQWPRDPNGKPLLPTVAPKGTLSPDGYPWGATLYDFYHVNRLPDIRGMVSIMTGSAICEAVRRLGELDAAAPEIEWAKLEGKPRVEGAADTEELIRCLDVRSRLLSFSGSSSQDAKTEKRGKQDEEKNREDVAEETREDESGDQNDGHEEDHEEDDKQTPEDEDSDREYGNKYDGSDTEPAFIPPPPTIPVTSPFHPSHYPKSWPVTPFEKDLSILLQERIPLYLLPRTLYVHDPFCLLAAREKRFQNTAWTSRPDIIRTYDLKLSDSVRLEFEKERQKAEALEEFKARTLIILRYKRTKEQIRNNEPVIEIPLPPYPRRMTKVEESHLFLSPVAKVGKGHHSVVYKGEWELPRDLFMKQRICQLCFEESAEKEIQRLKDTGRWTKLLKAAAWGPKGFTGRQPTQAELDEVNDPTNLERDGEIIEREITCVVPPNAAPSRIVDMVDQANVWDMLKKRSNTNAVQLQFTQSEDEDESTKDSYVAVIRIDPPFSYESQKNCTHEAHIFQGPVSRTAKFTVVAKLSIENDYHLAREASNYQKFPEHFFHHYNGYTIISQIHTIVPVNAVIPQFYGYYIPRKDEDPRRPPYLSPILLLEHCGKPVDPEVLSDEDQEECVSLVLRFQRAGWLHESVAPRNFLVQLGKPTEFPLTRTRKPEPSFRLIDFGRSRKYQTAGEKQAEEMEVLRMFQKLTGKMGYTLSI